MPKKGCQEDSRSEVCFKVFYLGKELMLKKFLRKSWIYKAVVKYRARKVRTALKLINIYPSEIDQIIDDYQYSISADYRTVMQVINLESCIKHVKATGVKGAFVETGTWTGGASAFALLSMMRNDVTLEYWGFDSFEGMPPPTKDDDEKSHTWAGDDPGGVNNASYDECLKYLRDTGYESEKLNLVKGWFDETLHVHKETIGPIAILRLDGDFYESTKTPLVELYDQVVVGGVVIVDDYGTFAGCKKAVDELVKGQDIHYVENGIRYFIKRDVN